MMKPLSMLLFVVPLLMVACEEEPLPIIMEEPPTPLKDTTYVNAAPSTAQDKVVLFEDFTGVSCPNCPKGHYAIKNMQASYPNRVVAIAIHPGLSEFNTAKPYAGEQDLNTTWGTTIFTVIPKPAGLPFGIADRVIGNLNSAQWEAAATQQMAKGTPANMELSIISYDPVSRELRYEVKMELTSDVNKPLYFSTAFTESHIIGTQDSLGVDVHHYEHNHILRDMPHFKQNLNPGNVPPAIGGRVFLKQYSYVLPANWNADNCYLIAYIHEEVEILQAKEVKLN